MLTCVPVKKGDYTYKPIRILKIIMNSINWRKLYYFVAMIFPLLLLFLVVNAKSLFLYRGRSHGGTDVKCTRNDVARAPFPGVVVSEAPPYGDGTCCDEGYLLRGSGAWTGK